MFKCCHCNTVSSYHATIKDGGTKQCVNCREKFHGGVNKNGIVIPSHPQQNGESPYECNICSKIS